jgi:hypothetical protein
MSLVPCPLSRMIYTVVGDAAKGVAARRRTAHPEATG